MLKIKRLVWLVATNTDTVVYYSLTFPALAHRQKETDLFLSDKGPTLETLDYTFRKLAVHQLFYISICISTLPTQHTTFIMLKKSIYTCCTLLTTKTSYGKKYSRSPLDRVPKIRWEISRIV